MTQTAPDQLKIALAARTIALQMLKERGMGRGRFLSVPTEADERN